MTMSIYSSKLWDYLMVKHARYFLPSTSLRTGGTSEGDSGSKNEKEESARIKQFHEKLKLQPIPRIKPRERFVELVLVEIDPKTGEIIMNSEKDPTKWGDWQTGGRVSDF